MTTISITRRMAVCAMLIAAIALAPACKRKVHSRATDEESPRIAAVLNMGDPKAEPQLISGFYGVEAGAWRWTGKQFTVNLRTPAGAVQKGAKLTAKLTVPSVVIDKNKTISLSATAGNFTLAPETYTTPGEYLYIRDVPASVLTSDALRVNFALDKALPPAPPDIRELGVVVLSVGLESK